jgi:hypothetical protein
MKKQKFKNLQLTLIILINFLTGRKVLFFKWTQNIMHKSLRDLRFYLSILNDTLRVLL